MRGVATLLCARYYPARAWHRLHMRKRRVSAGKPDPEADGASPTKRRGIGKNVGVAVARIEAVEAAGKQIGNEAPFAVTREHRYKTDRESH